MNKLKKKYRPSALKQNKDTLIFRLTFMAQMEKMRPPKKRKTLPKVTMVQTVKRPKTDDHKVR